MSVIVALDDWMKIITSYYLRFGSLVWFRRADDKGVEASGTLCLYILTVQVACPVGKA